MLFRLQTCIFLILIFQPYILLANEQRRIDSLLLIPKENLSDSALFYHSLNIAIGSKDTDTIIKYSELAIEKAQIIEISPAGPMLVKGNALLISGKLTLALKHFTESANLYKSENNQLGLAAAYNYISEAYKIQENYTNAINYLKYAAIIYENVLDTSHLALINHNLAYVYFLIHDYDSALRLYQKSAIIYLQLEDKIGRAYCIGGAGLVYSKKQMIDSAIINLNQSIDILKSNNDYLAAIEFMIEYSNILQNIGKIKESHDIAIQCYSLALKNNFAENIRDASLRLSQVFSHLKEFDSAYYYQSLFIAYSDSIKNLETIQKMADLRTEFEVSQKQQEVDILTKKRKYQQFVIAALLLVIVMGGGIIYVYYLGLKRSRKLTAILEERRKLLEQQSTELRELNHIKDRFFSIISHDLRGPISSLGGISVLIRESIELDNPTLLNEITEYIDQTVISLTGLLENLLNWAMSQQGQLMYKEEELDTKELISEVVKIFTAVSISKNIRLQLNLQENLFVKGDANSLMMVIRNLISNALKFTHSGGTIQVSSYSTHDRKVEIMVVDSGIGIEPEKLESLFVLSNNKSTRGTEHEKGLGLGLTLVKEFVNLNKGTITVESEVGKGSRFILRF